MNLLLLWPSEVSGDLARVTGRRAQHLLELLGKEVGDHVLVGIVGTSRGRGEVLSRQVSPAEVTLRLIDQAPLLASATHLIVAIPRPKALSRLIQHAASFGIGRLDLVRTARVESSYLDSKRLEPERIQEDLLLGLEQGRWVHLPQFGLFPHLEALTEQLAAPAQCQTRAVLHPTAPRWMSDLGVPGRTSAWTLAFGPDGGFLANELAQLEEHHFQAACLGPGVLRTETAVAAALGQLALCQHLLRARALH